MHAFTGAGFAAVFAAVTVQLGCSLVLDFDKPIAPTDAEPAPDAEVASCVFGEPNNAPAAATSLVSAELAASLCGLDDVDYYAFAIDSMNTTGVAVTLNETVSSASLIVRLLSLDGAIEYARADGDMPSKVLQCRIAACPPAAYLIEIKRATSATAAIANYTLQFAQL
jgi:hypothetical protein